MKAWKNNKTPGPVAGGIIALLPNMLSVGRLVLALGLPFAQSPVTFAALYLLCGASDVLDGAIARKFGLQTALGARLDSAADAVFWLVVLVLLHTRAGAYTAPVLLGMAVVALWRGANALITRRKFGRWGMLHSLGNKAAGLVLYVACLFVFLFGALALYGWVAVFVVALLSVLEETVVLLRSHRYRPNPKGFFGAM